MSRLLRNKWISKKLSFFFWPIGLFSFKFVLNAITDFLIMALSSDFVRRDFPPMNYIFQLWSKNLVIRKTHWVTKGAFLSPWTCSVIVKTSWQTRSSSHACISLWCVCFSNTINEILANFQTIIRGLETQSFENFNNIWKPVACWNCRAITANMSELPHP